MWQQTCENTAFLDACRSPSRELPGSPLLLSSTLLLRHGISTGFFSLWGLSLSLSLSLYFFFSVSVTGSHPMVTGKPHDGTPQGDVLVRGIAGSHKILGPQSTWSSPRSLALGGNGHFTFGDQRAASCSNSFCASGSVTYRGMLQGADTCSRRDCGYRRAWPSVRISLEVR